jgi:hypothetical protein
MRIIRFAVPILGVVLVQAPVKANAPVNPMIYDPRAIVIAEAHSNGAVPPELALAVAREESNFDPIALSSAGARGLMQVMPDTARGEFGVDPDLLWEPATNARIGIAYLERLYRKYGQNWELALSHYNGGTLKLDGSGEAVPHAYTREYVANVMRRWDDYADAPAIARLLDGSLPIAPTTSARRSAGGASVVTGSRIRPARSLLEEMEHARLSFRRALRAHQARESQSR